MGEVVDLTVEILKDIRSEIRGLREEQHAIREEQHAMREEQHAMREEMRGMHEEIRGTNRRLDHLIEFSGTAWRDLERRVTVLEQQARQG